jgi:hypothetical protein
MNKMAYKWFGFAIIPYFVFDYVYWQRNFLTTFGAVGDAMGNIVFTICCYVGFHNKKN